MKPTDKTSMSKSRFQLQITFAATFLSLLAAFGTGVATAATNPQNGTSGTNGPSRYLPRPATAIQSRAASRFASLGANKTNAPSAAGAVHAHGSLSGKRPADEVNALMELYGVYIEGEFDRFMRENIRFVQIGRREGLPALPRQQGAGRQRRHTSSSKARTRSAISSMDVRSVEKRCRRPSAVSPSSSRTRSYAER